MSFIRPRTTLGEVLHDQLQQQLLDEWNARIRRGMIGRRRERSESRRPEDDTDEGRRHDASLQELAQVRRTKCILCWFIFLLLVLFALQWPSTRPHEARHTAAPTARTPLVQLSPIARVGGHTALDRAGYMLPLRWRSWLFSPPYLETALSYQPKQTWALRGVRSRLENHFTDDAQQARDGERLLRQMRHAVGLIGHETYDPSFPSETMAWLRDAATCWNRTVTIHCRFQHGDVVTRTRHLLLSISGHVRSELAFWDEALWLFQRLQGTAADQQAQLLQQATDMLHDLARNAVPLQVNSPASAPPASLLSKEQASELANLYEYHAEGCFYELLAETLASVIPIRIKELEMFNRTLSQALQDFGNSQGWKGIYVMKGEVISSTYTNMKAWIAGDFNSILHMRRLPAHQMRSEACEWTLRRMPRRRINMTTSQSPSDSTNATFHPGDVTAAIREERIKLANSLLIRLWLDDDGDGGVMWWWDAGGSWTWSVHDHLKKEFRQIVEDRILAGEGAAKAGAATAHWDMPPRPDGAHLLSSAPALRSRVECARRHWALEDDGEAPSRGSLGGE